jgi:hypothetical protein
MTDIILPVNDNAVVIAADPFHEPCQLCGKVAELRPYGPNGEYVCFACGMTDEAAAKAQFSKRLPND